MSSMTLDFLGLPRFLLTGGGGTGGGMALESSSSSSSSSSSGMELMEKAEETLGRPPPLETWLGLEEVLFGKAVVGSSSSSCCLRGSGSGRRYFSLKDREYLENRKS